MLDYGICNVTYRLDKIEKLLFELGYEVIGVITQIFVNSPNHKTERIFSPFALLVTSSTPLYVEFIIRSMLGEKERFYILAQQIAGKRAWNLCQCQ